MYSSDDSEFNYELEEEEAKLYTQLYFGDEFTSQSEPSSKKNNENLEFTSLSASNNINCSNTLEQTEPSCNAIDSLCIKGPSSCDRSTINNNLSRFNSQSSQGTNSLTISHDGIRNSDTQEQPDICIFEKPKPSSKTVVRSSAINTKKKSENTIKDQVKNKKILQPRKRNLSQCSSIDSISGREPLDNLYCNVSYEEDVLDEILEASFNITSSLTTESDLNQSEEELEENSYLFRKNHSKNIRESSDDLSDDELSKYSICNTKKGKKKLNKKSKSLQSLKVDGSNLDDLQIVPPPSPKRIVTVEGGSISDSNQSIIILEAVKTKKKVCKLKKKKERLIILSSDESSPDESFDNSQLSSKLPSPLVLNIQNSQFVSKNEATKFRKSRVIFSKDKTLTKKIPSCPKWTQEMATLYDSDYPDAFSVQAVHKSQSDSPEKWKICAEDYPKNRARRQRYFEERCVRCKEYGHTVRKCPKVPHCLYCGSDKHTYIQKCPHNCCLRCGGSPHSYCPSTDPRIVCHECGNLGHSASLCPDLWRRFHATTSGSVPVKPSNTSVSCQRRTPYCYNCAKAGHYGHECRINNMKKYQPISTEIFSYLPPTPPLEEEINTSRQEWERSSYNENASFNDSLHMGKQEGWIHRAVPVPFFWVQRFLGDGKPYLDEIQARSGTSITCQVRRNAHNLNIFGSETEIENAIALVTLVRKKTPKKEYREFVRRMHNNNNNWKEEEEVEMFDLSKEAHASPRPRSPFPPALSFPSPYLPADENKNKNNKKKKKRVLSPTPSSPLVAKALMKVPLPFPLPTKRPEVLSALSVLIRKGRASKGVASKLEHLKEVLSFFEGREGNPCCPSPSSSSWHGKKVSKQVQFLSVLLSNRKVWLGKMEDYRRQITNSTKKVLNAKLHAEVSDLYLGITNPPLTKLPSMLATARKKVESLIKKKKKIRLKKKMKP